MTVSIVVFEHSNEVNKEFPNFIEFSQEDGGKLCDVGDDLMEKTAVERTIDIGKHFFKSFSGLIPRIFRDDELSQRPVSWR